MVQLSGDKFRMSHESQGKVVFHVPYSGGYTPVQTFRDDSASKKSTPA